MEKRAVTVDGTSIRDNGRIGGDCTIVDLERSHRIVEGSQVSEMTQQKMQSAERMQSSRNKRKLRKEGET